MYNFTKTCLMRKTLTNNIYFFLLLTAPHNDRNGLLEN